MSREKFALAKKSDARNEKGKGKGNPLRYKLSEPPRRSELPGLNANNIRNLPTKTNSVNLEDVKRITEVREIQISNAEVEQSDIYSPNSPMMRGSIDHTPQKRPHDTEEKQEKEARILRTEDPETTRI